MITITIDDYRRIHHHLTVAKRRHDDRIEYWLDRAAQRTAEGKTADREDEFVAARERMSNEVHDLLMRLEAAARGAWGAVAADGDPPPRMIDEDGIPLDGPEYADDPPAPWEADPDEPTAPWAGTR